MDEKSIGGLPWSINGSRTQLCAGQLSAELDIARPDSGLSGVLLGGRRLTAALHCVHRIPDKLPRPAPTAWHESAWPLPMSDAYVRGNDLVVSYAPSGDWPFSPQVYWQANSLAHVAGVIGSVSLLVSVQTHLLDTWPRIGVRSGLASEEMLRAFSSDGRLEQVERIIGEQSLSESTAVCCIVYRHYEAPLSCIEIMQANDYCNVRVWQEERLGGGVDWELFSEFLEKGVIRRARLHSAFVSRENDLEIAAACCEAVQRSSLPLTT